MTGWGAARRGLRRGAICPMVEPFDSDFCERCHSIARRAR